MHSPDPTETLAGLASYLESNGGDPYRSSRRTDADRLAAAQQWADGLARQNGKPYHVDTAMRGWLRVFCGTTESRSIVAFVGSTSGGVYAAKTATKYGKRLGNVFQYAADFGGAS